MSTECIVGGERGGVCQMGTNLVPVYTMKGMTLAQCEQVMTRGRLEFIRGEKFLDEETLV